MPFDSDVALMGTGVAPLVAASHLLAQGKSIVILNPDLDFFLEDSELSLDPLVKPDVASLRRSDPEHALTELRPDFPGAVEFWSAAVKSGGMPSGFRDKLAPHVRSRARLWVHPQTSEKWERFEDLYVEASDASMNPQILDGLSAARRFPGYSSSSAADLRGMLVPKVSDVDVIRYRNGLLEFVRERLGSDRVVCSATQVELMEEGVRFHAGGAPRTARLNEGLLVFWTPRLTSWVLAQAKRAEVTPVLPKGVRVWEEWSLISRDGLDPGTVGIYEDMTVWAEVEGAPELPESAPKFMAVLKPGQLVDLQSTSAPQAGMSWGSADSFNSLSRLCHDFLKWEKFSINSMRPRAIFEWNNPRPWALSRGPVKATVIPSCDGYLVDVVGAARAACT